MGFDLHGMNPKRNTAKPEILVEYIKENGWTDWDKINKDEKQDAYFKAQNAWEDDNPGIYFRNNVWWWRPLWEFICHTCDDILTEKEMEAGSYNDGKEISESKANVIASRLQLYIDNGDAERWGKERQATLDAQEDEECNICEGTGKRQEPPETGAGDMKCDGCEGKGSRRPFDTNYPFDIGNVQEFAKFAAQSGGFNIC